jgi:hypothetical protein
MRSRSEFDTLLQQLIFMLPLFNSVKYHGLYLTGTSRFPPASKLAGIQRSFL